MRDRWAVRRGPRPEAVGERRAAIHAWQDRIRDPSLTVLLVLEVGAIYVAAPLAARGLPIARTLADTLVLAALALVVLLSQRSGPIVLILMSVAAMTTTLVRDADWPPLTRSVLYRGGSMCAFAALTWVVLHAVYAPGRITVRRLQGAVVVYLSAATIFASAYGLIWELIPGAFADLAAPMGRAQEASAMLYFSLATLTTTGFGDIVAVDPFTRSLANLESVMGVFYVAITVARLVTLELEDRRGRQPPRG
jgi:Ion channel